MSNYGSEREVVMNIVRDVQGRHGARSPNTVIEHASGRAPCANTAGARLHSPSGGSPRQTRSELSTSLAWGDGVLLARAWHERKEIVTCGEKQL
jgi:hypothetical protein